MQPIVNKKLLLFLSLLLISGRLSLLIAQVKVSPEYEVKAVFLFNFAQFVVWPDSVFSTKDNPLIIGVLGKDPFGNYLDQTVTGESINGHPLIIQRYQQLSDIKTCHILFISKSDDIQLKQILDNLKGQNILTVGDTDDFAQLGGIIRFLTIDNKIRFQINLAAAKDAELTISSKLLRVADIINNN